MRAAILLLAVCQLSGCGTQRSSGAGRPEQVRQVRLDVPFFPDSTDQCGPSVLASVLGFWKKPETPAVLRQEVYRAGLKGSLTVDMLLAAESRGLSADTIDGGLAQAKAELDAGHPLIVFVNLGFRFIPIGHYMVVTGYDDAEQVLFAHSGSKRDRRIPYATFDRQWEKTNRWTLLILPPNS